jgi:hypothetical protein
MMSAVAESSVSRGLQRTPRDLAGWAARFDPARLPVLATTAAQIDYLRAVEDHVDAHTVAEAVGDDPLLSLRLMAHLSVLRRGREGGEPETLTAALVMLGIPPFFAAFGSATTVEEHLGSQAEALEGFRAVLRRSRRAAQFAMAFAAHRMDHDAAVIRDAALLHDFAELLVWLEAPSLALEMRRRQQADPTLRSSALQRELLHVELVDLQHHLMVAWRLPSLLVSITDDHAQRCTPQLTNVRLAISLARHSAGGWDNVALSDDFAAIGSLLQLGAPHVERLVRDVDGD